MSEIRANTVSNAAGTGPVTLTGQYAAKAWVNFNGQNTVTIRESGNVSSITDNGTGNYTINFTNSMIDANLSCTASCGNFSGAGASNRLDSVNLPTVNNMVVFTFSTSNVNADFPYVCVQVFR